MLEKSNQSTELLGNERAQKTLDELREKFPGISDDKIHDVIGKLKIKRQEDGDIVDEKSEIRSTPDEDLLLGKERTEIIVTDIRKIVAEDPYFNKIRRYLKESIPDLEIKDVNGEPHVVVYRSIDVNYEEATTAAGFCKNRGPKSEFFSKIALQDLQHKMIRYSDESSDHTKEKSTSDHPGVDFFEKTVGNHMAESDDSPYIPASTFKYARTFAGSRDNKILECTVPLKFIVPVYQYAESYMPGYRDEKEVAIAGRIEPEWIKVVDEDEFSTLEENEQVRVVEFQRLQEEKREEESKKGGINRSIFKVWDPNKNY